MNADEFKAKLEISMGLKLIVAGMAGLIDDEGYKAREVFEMVEATKKNVFPALMEMEMENKNESK